MVLSTLSTTGTVIFFFVTALFILSLIIKRNDIADIAWGIGILLAVVVSYSVRITDSLLMHALLLLVSLWGIRLSVRILLKNIKKSEDPRYRKWRDEWGKWFYLRSYFQVYLLQGLLMIVVAYPVVHASVYGTGGELGTLALLGVFVWCIGYFFEVVGDYQLDSFIGKAENRGKIMKYGLWKYSRHPNYFGEVTMWWGIFLMIATLPLSFVALIGPITITFLIFKVSGIPMLEKHFEGNPEFEEYKKQTSVFFPLPQKKAS